MSLASEQTPAANAPETPGARRLAWLRALVFGLAIALCYANALRVPFLFDDPFLSPERPDIELRYDTRPLVWASFDLNRALAGRETWSYHVFNLLVHLGCALLLYGVLRRTLERVRTLAAGTAETLAFVTTLLWVVHPLQTSAVTYLSQRAETLGAFFYLLVVYAFLRSSADARARGWQALCLLALAAGFATKETIATAPVFLFLYDAVFLSGGPLAALRKRRGFYAALVLTTLVLAGIFVVPLLRAQDISAGFAFEEFGALDYARTQPGVILHYLRLAVWPHPLCFDYDWPIARERGDYLLQALGIGALLLTSLVLLVRRAWLGFAGVVFFLVLAPSSSIVPIKDPAVEHRMYLALAAFLVLVVVGAWRLLARVRGARRAGTLLALAAALALAATTVRRNHDYRSALSLWGHTAALAPHNARARGNLGAALLDEGRTEEAIAELSAAMALDPKEGFILLDLGKAYLSLGEVGRGISFLKRGVAASPDPRGLGALGAALYGQANYLEAVRAFEQALALEPEDAGAHYRLANALAQLGRLPAALQHFQEALRLAPEFQEAHINVAALLASEERTAEALEHSLRALEIEPNTSMELHNHALLLRALGRFDESLATFRRILATDPGMPEAHAGLAETVALKPDATRDERQEALRGALEANALTHSANPEFVAILAAAQAALAQDVAPGAAQGAADAGDAELIGQALLLQGDYAGARAHYQAAVARHPEDARAHHGLAQALRFLGRGAEAIPALRAALRLDPELRAARVDLASTLTELGRADEALEEALKAYAAPPDAPEQRFELGQLLRALGRPAEAMATFLESIRLAPELAEARVAYAETVCLKPDASPDERREALRLAREADELAQSQRVDFLAVLGMSEAAAGDFEAAVAALDKALKLPDAQADAELAERLRGLRADFLARAGG